MSFGTAHGHFTLSTKQTVQSTYISLYFPIQPGSNQIPIISQMFVFFLSFRKEFFFWFNPAVTIVGRPCYNSLGRDLAQRCQYNKHTSPTDSTNSTQRPEGICQSTVYIHQQATATLLDFDGGELHNKARCAVKTRHIREALERDPTHTPSGDG